MNLDDLQHAWKAQQEDQLPLPDLKNRLKEAHQPIDRIRRNMRKELTYQVCSIVIMGLWPLIFRFNQQFSLAFYCAFTLLIIVSGYYFYRFYQFFRQMHNYSGNSKDSLYELYYEIRINMETYKSFSFLLVPFAIVAALLIVFHSRMMKHPEQPLMAAGDWIFISAVVAFMIFFIIWATNWWVEHFYGKHAKQIRRLLDELKEPE